MSANQNAEMEFDHISMSSATTAIPATGMVARANALLRSAGSVRATTVDVQYVPIIAAMALLSETKYVMVVSIVMRRVVFYADGSVPLKAAHQYVGMG